jgi:hypothetical protein
MEGVAALHEILNEMHVIISLGIRYKIDFHKAFDIIKRTFLLKVLELKGFSSFFNDWVMKTVIY